MDEELFDYPWVYAVEVGRWYLDDQEAARLREYLLRGGFLVVDDFHGSYEWAGFASSMNRVFPDRSTRRDSGDRPRCCTRCTTSTTARRFRASRYVWSGTDVGRTTATLPTGGASTMTASA